jgi:hypothetical protein
MNLSVLSCLFLSITFAIGYAAPQETIDFARLPAQGLKFSVSSATSTTTMVVTPEDGQSTTTKETSRRTNVFTQEILALKDGEVVRVERDYGDCGASTTLESESATEPREMERASPLAGRRIRVGWHGKVVKIGEREGGKWVEASGRVKRSIRLGRVRRPIIPLPKTRKKVGETWEFGPQELKDYFSFSNLRFLGYDADEEGPAMKAVFRIARVLRYEGMNCALIKMSLHISVGEGVSKSIDGVCYFSLRHRIVVGMKATGRSIIDRRGEQGGVRFLFKSETNSKMAATVKILAEGSAEEGEDR